MKSVMQQITPHTPLRKPGPAGAAMGGVSGDGPAAGFFMAADTPDTIIVPEEEIDESLDQPWHVIVYDDPVNLMNYVTLIIQRIFGYPAATAEKIMMEVHTNGKSVVWTGSAERAEHYVQQLHSSQLLAAMKKAG